MNKKMHKRKKWLLISVLVMALTAVPFIASDQQQDSSAVSDTEVPYVDIQGDVKSAEDVTEVDQAYFDSMFDLIAKYELNSGWYLLTENVSLTAPLKISGGVKLIIGDGLKLTVTVGATAYAVEVGSGSNFAVYSQPVINGKGELNAKVGNGVNIGPYGGLINTASIIVAAASKDGVHNSGDGVSITNGATGHIKCARYGLFLEGSANVVNYGTIESTGNTGIHSASTSSNISVVNFETGVIKGTPRGIYLFSAAGSSIVNYGEIRGGTSSNSFAVYIGFDGPVINHKGGLMQAGETGVSLGAGGTLDNSGVIRSTYGILAIGVSGGSLPVEIINREGGLIEGIAYGVRFKTGTLDNYGSIKSTDSVSYGIQADSVVTITNHAGALIKAGNDSSDGIRLSGGSKSTVVNYGTITAYIGINAYTNTPAKIINHEGGLIEGVTLYGIRLSTGGEIENYGTITGLNRGISANSTLSTVVLLNAGTINGNIVLSNAANHLTFAAGSVINGNFNMGTDVNSTLTFTGDLPFNGKYIYSTVNGTASLGTAYVSFDKIPDPYSGETIVLIDATNGSVSGTPDNSLVTVEGSGFALLKETTRLIATMGKIVNIEIMEGEGSVEVTDGNGTSYGTVTGTGGPVTLPMGTTSITLIATGVNGYQFVKCIVGSADIRVSTMVLQVEGSYMNVQAYLTDDLDDLLIITLEDKGGAGASRYFTLNGQTYDYTMPFTVLKSSDTLSVSASAAEAFEFVRWQDSGGNSQSLSYATEDLNLSEYGSAVTFTSVFAQSDDMVTVILSSDPEGVVLYYTIEGLNEAVYDGPFVMSRAEKLSIRADEVDGYDFLEWNGPGGKVGNTLEITGIPMPAEIGEIVFGAVFVLQQTTAPGPKYYYINATADVRTSISPAGTVMVLKGDKAVFYFKADEGFTVAGVMVDGRHLSQEEIDKGYYAFRDVNSNHSIEVLSAISSNVITLTIDVKGKGYAEYSVNGSPFVLYSKSVTLPESADVTVRAVVYEGYSFREWRMGSAVMTAEEIGFTEVTSSIHLVLYFTGEDEGGISDTALLLIAAALLIVAALLLWPVLYKRSTYEVVKIGHSVEIVGKDRARRKKAYRFTIAGGIPGTMFYRVGDGQWKDISPGVNGEYVIPKEDVTDDLEIEQS